MQSTFSLRRFAEKSRRRPGIGLVEMVVVLIIGIAIIVTGLALANSTMRQSTVSNEIQTLTNLSASVYKIRTASGYPTSPSDIMLSLDTMQLVPSNVGRTGSGASMSLFNSWGGGITIQATSGGGTFSITYTQIPKADCVQLVMGMKAGILQSVGAGGAASENINDLVSSDAASMCSNSVNTVTWDTQTF